ncbi:MAG: AEC family transporter [Deltaproteobacteria bacterium]|nr:AEC family transporter [Deltaproteobacteria bacterium]
MAPILKQAFESILTLFMMGLVGVYVVHRGWVTREVKDFLARLVVGCTLPLYLFYTAVQELTKKDIPGLMAGTTHAMLTMTLTFLLSLVFVKIAKVRQGRRGLFSVGFTFSNTMFLGLPINVALFGESALPYVMSYFFSNSLMFWTLGNYMMSLDGPGKKSEILSLDTVKRFFNPPLIGFFIGLLVVILEVPIPKFLTGSAKLLGSTTTPLAIMYIGMGLGDLNLKTIHMEKDIIYILLGRFLICPLLTVTICLAFNLFPAMSRVFVIQSSLPVLANCSIMAGYYRSDTSFALILVSLTTFLSLLTVPIFRMAVSLF